MNNYIVYDGRALFDIDEASVVEAFQANTNKAAIKYYKRGYKGYDYVLCDENNNIIATPN